MTKFTVLIAATALASTSYAATVNLETTKCINDNTPLEQFSIEIGTSKPVAKTLPSVCGLRVVSASGGINVTTIQCQAFHDTEGAQPGSAVFTYAEPASIATNPIQEKSILCTIPSSSNDLVLDRRQDDNSTASSALPTLSTASLAPQSTVFITSTGSEPVETAVVNSTSSADALTTIETIVASGGSSLPTSGGNATTPSNTGRPSATQSSATPGESTGAAGTIGIGSGVVAGAFAMLFL